MTEQRTRVTEATPHSKRLRQRESNAGPRNATQQQESYRGGVLCRSQGAGRLPGMTCHRRGPLGPHVCPQLHRDTAQPCYYSHRCRQRGRGLQRPAGSPASQTGGTARTGIETLACSSAERSGSYAARSFWFEGRAALVARAGKDARHHLAVPAGILALVAGTAAIVMAAHVQQPAPPAALTALTEPAKAKSTTVTPLRSVAPVPAAA
jgi:hypothetical protein